MTRLPAPDDQPPGTGQLRYDSGAGHPGDDPLEAQRARLAGLWALVLRRFRAYAHRNGAPAGNRDRHEEGR